MWSTYWSKGRTGGAGKTSVESIDEDDDVCVVAVVTAATTREDEEATKVNANLEEAIDSTEGTEGMREKWMEVTLGRNKNRITLNQGRIAYEIVDNFILFYTFLLFLSSDTWSQFEINYFMMGVARYLCLVVQYELFFLNFLIFLCNFITIETTGTSSKTGPQTRFTWPVDQTCSKNYEVSIAVEWNVQVYT